MTAQQPTAPWTPERALAMFRSWCDISVTHREHCERWDGFDNLDDFAQIAVGGLESATAEIERQRARADKAEAELQRVTLTGDTVASDASLYKGNSVRHWWDKCQAYTDAFRKRDKAEARADGLASQLAAAMAANDSLTAELAKAQQQPASVGTVEAWRHHANEWADAATNVPAMLDCLKSGAMTIEQVKEANRKDCEHARSTAPQQQQPEQCGAWGFCTLPVAVPSDREVGDAVNSILTSREGWERTQAIVGAFITMGRRIGARL